MPSKKQIQVPIVDQHNEIVGTAVRAELFEKQYNFRTVHVLLRAPDNRLILQLLRSDHPRSPDRLGSSAAGYVHLGESYDQSARRTLDKELGLHGEISFHSQIEMNDLGCRKFVAIFVGSARDEIKLNQSEYKEIVFMTDDEISDQISQNPEAFTKTFQMIFEATFDRSH